MKPYLPVFGTLLILFLAVYSYKKSREIKAKEILITKNIRIVDTVRKNDYFLPIEARLGNLIISQNLSNVEISEFTIVDSAEHYTVAIVKGVNDILTVKDVARRIQSVNKYPTRKNQNYFNRDTSQFVFEFYK